PSSRRSCALPNLSLHVLALVANALALVRLGRALLADDRRRLAHELLGDAPHDHARRLWHLELDAVGGCDRHGVRVADGQLQVLALQLRAVADALDLQTLLVARRDTLDHVGHERAREPVQRTVFAAVGRTRHEQLLAVLLDLDVARDALRQFAFGTVDADLARLDRDRDATRHRDWLPADSRHRSAHQTCARTSPPTPSARASWPVITPCEVETIAVPMPPRTFGMCLAST